MGNPLSLGGGFDKLPFICRIIIVLLFIITANSELPGFFISSEGALYVILPYDYPVQRSSHFLNTHRSLLTTLSIDAVMTLLTVISMKTKITEMTISDDNF